MIGLMVFVILIVAINPSKEFVICVAIFALVMFILAIIEANNNYNRNHKKKGDDE